MSKPCIKTTHLGESIEVFQGESGYYFHCGDEFVRWSSHFDFAEPIEALSICILHQWCDKVNRLEHPAAIFATDTGKILHVNKGHHRWLGHGCIQMHHDTILHRVVAQEQVVSRIESIGSRVVGIYEILNAEQNYKFNPDPTSWEGIWESITAFNGFANYGAKSQEILSRWVSLGDTPEFYRQYLSDLGQLGKLRGIA